MKASNHGFILAGMKPGDTFMGCPKCSTQLPANAAGPNYCSCGARRLIYTVGSEDRETIARHNRLRDQVNRKLSENRSEFS
jgi:hypothetical protein